MQSNDHDFFETCININKNTGMSSQESIKTNTAPDGIRGLVMMAPIIAPLAGPILGFPLLIHVIGGVIAAGLGIAVVSAAENPDTGKIIDAVKDISIRSFNEVFRDAAGKQSYRSAEEVGDIQAAEGSSNR